MRLWILPFRLLGIIALSILISAAWLLRHEILSIVRPQVHRVTDALAPHDGAPTSAARAHGRDKVDSLLGWNADSVVLTAGEMAALLLDGLSPEARSHLDSVTVTLGDGRLSVDARLETSQIPPDQLGPLAGVLRAWETVTVAGDVASSRPGQAEWRIDALTLRGITLPPEASRTLINRGLPGSEGGRVAVTLPKGVARITVRPAGVALFPERAR
ncbi:MAG: hypothetical protein SGJ01_09435 [Gemmatimonadota bacterium]|nr:hypothetical protein [Gemmatimonadota bacterium]